MHSIREPTSIRRIWVMMQHSENLLRRLSSATPTERLEAARFFAEHALPEHEAKLTTALAKENVAWIRAALKRALSRISPTVEIRAESSVDTDDIPERFAAQVYAEALERATSQLIHEVEPILGTLRLAAETEIPEFESSRTKRNIDRLDDLLSAFSRIQRAASAPMLEEFSLDDVIHRCIQETRIPAGVVIQKAGPQPCVIEGDQGLILLCFSNGLRNAIEATATVQGEMDCFPITVVWGHTDVDCWISIVDLGSGFKGNIHRALEMGTSTKPGHLGMGLATANQALTSMGGQLLLVPNPKGVRFEMRWPKKTTK